jgi:hypothetical protein
MKHISSHHQRVLGNFEGKDSCRNLKLIFGIIGMDLRLLVPQDLSWYIYPICPFKISFQMHIWYSLPLQQKKRKVYHI